MILMKKYIITLLALTFLLLTGCNNKPQKQAPVTEPDAKTQETEIPETPKTPEKIAHEISSTVDTSGFGVVDEIDYDFDSDGTDDKLQLLATSFEKVDGELLLDDGTNWMITVTTANGTYKLFEEFVQLGVPQVDVANFYNDNIEKAIILTLDTRTGKSVTHYTFSDGVFYEELVYSTDSFTQNGADIIAGIN